MEWDPFPTPTPTPQRLPSNHPNRWLKDPLSNFSQPQIEIDRKIEHNMCGRRAARLITIVVMTL